MTRPDRTACRIIVINPSDGAIPYVICPTCKRKAEHVSTTSKLLPIKPDEVLIHYAEVEQTVTLRPCGHRFVLLNSRDFRPLDSP